jgi:monoamine oxidase
VNPPEREVDVAVVGAGLSGLAAARALEAAGASHAVLEARERVGGRTLNEGLGDGKVVEIGGQWVGPTQDRLYELARELGIETFPTFTAGENLLELGGRLRRYSGAIPRLNPVSLLEIERVRRRLDSLAAKVPPPTPWKAPDAETLDATTLGTWLDRKLHTRTARRVVEIAARTVWGADSGHISLLYALWYVRSAGGFNPLIEVEGGAQQDRFVGGSQLIALRMAEQLGTPPLLGAPVTRIERRDPGVVVAAGDDGVAAKRAIVAMAPPLCQHVRFEPELPPARAGLGQRMPWGSYIKCIAVYDEPFWRADGLNGEGVSDIGPATTTFDNTPPDGSPGVLLAFVSGGEARALQRLDASERRERVLGGLARLFGARARSPERWIEQDWARERYTGGGPVCFMPPGVWTGHGRAVREPVGPIHWAGTETSDVWSGYMDGAVRAGERAAAEALAAL